jgi:hypothetical protein
VFGFLTEHFLRWLETMPQTVPQTVPQTIPQTVPLQTMRQQAMPQQTASSINEDTDRYCKATCPLSPLSPSA